MPTYPAGIAFAASSVFPVLVHRRSVSAAQLSQLQDFTITSVAASGTMFASHSPRAAPPNPAFALPSPTAHSPDAPASHLVSVSASGASETNFVTPLASPLPSPVMSPLRGGQGGGEGGFGSGVWGQGHSGIVKASSPPSEPMLSHDQCIVCADAALVMMSVRNYCTVCADAALVSVGAT